MMFSLLVLESGLQLPALSVGYLRETRVVSRCKYLHPILNAISLPLIYSSLIQQSMYMQVSLPRVLSQRGVSHWSIPRLCPCSPDVAQCHGGATCPFRQPACCGHTERQGCQGDIYYQQNLLATGAAAGSLLVPEEAEDQMGTEHVASIFTSCPQMQDEATFLFSPLDGFLGVMTVPFASSSRCSHLW